MKTKILMSSSSIIMLGLGITLSFIPAEIIAFFEFRKTVELEFIFQLLGAILFGFGLMNWMARRTLIGGIYNKPLAIGNFAHFLVGGLGLAKAVIANPEVHYIFWVLAAVYVLFAIWFGLVMVKHPLVKTEKS
ncbi:MAG TPA: hypothetical protein VFM70_07105 [Salinimicrobium sp.]|nr:hypothetical protein [Salinimicrobium sp.]